MRNEDTNACRPLRVLFCCTGIGVQNRGIESFFREAFDGLKTLPELEIKLIKGGRQPLANEHVIPCLKRTSKGARLLGRLTGRSAYAVEQWSSFYFVAREIRNFRPQVIFTSEADLIFLLRRFRKWIGVPFQVLFSNGGPCHPPFDRHDFVHQVTPQAIEEALSAGEPSSKHIMVPYGIKTPTTPPPNQSEKNSLREQLGLPLHRPIVLSVGWISREHKRMHWLIEEVARLPEPRPFLQLLGAMDESSLEILEMGNRALGPRNFSIRSVPYEAVTNYYRAADIFALASLSEGFGRAYVEALMHGLPTLGHCHPAIEWVLGKSGIRIDFSLPGACADALQHLLNQPDSWLGQAANKRWEDIRSRFDWSVVRPSCRAMFQTCALASI